MSQIPSLVTATVELSIQRLEDIVEQETAALRERKVVNLKDFNDRKSQALLELMRVDAHSCRAGRRAHRSPRALRC